MPLVPGQTLTHYEILGPLGAGGMGEVYRARDTRLEREVAIKVLPEHFADDEERLRRFEREAKTLASLNHPNLAHVYGIDQVEDTCFIAMELVDGEDLATRLKRGPLPVDESIDVCRQIAEGLETAHEAGVVHRDLKPANARLTPEGVVKLLDFGLAKPVRPKAGGGGTTSAEPDSFLVTEEGLVLGTPTYMSPEQARGKPVDRRTDIWAFGCVLYECLTGRRAFAGDSLTDVLAAIVDREPDWSLLPASTPPSVRRVLERCLDKDPRTRLRDVGEARVVLSGGRTLEPADGPPEGAPAARPGRTLALLATGAALAVLGIWGAGLLGSRTAPSEPSVARHALRLTVPRVANSPTISPDGRRLLFGYDRTLRVYDLAEASSRELPGTEGRARTSPYTWSADGEAIAFERNGFLETLRLEESSSVRRCALPGEPALLSWADDGSFLIELGEKSEGVYVLGPGAGEPELLDWLDPEQLTVPQSFNPSFLPGGDEFLVTAMNEGEPWVHLASLASRSMRPLVRGSCAPRYVAPGWIAWVDQGRLLVQPFDRETSSFTGAPRELVAEVKSYAAAGRAAFSFSDDGLLVYAEPEPARSIEWIDRQGRVLAPAAEARPYGSLGLDRTGRWLAATVAAPKEGISNLWILDLERGTSRLFLDRPGAEITPAWSPDGKRLAFAADWNGPPNVWVQDVDGGDPKELVPFDGRTQTVGAWSADGRAVVYSRFSANGKSDLWMVDVDTLERRRLLETPFGEFGARVSPDGRWLAYGSDESGTWEVYVATFPDLRGARRVSAEGEGGQCWRSGSSDLYYRTRAGGIAFAHIGEREGLPDPDSEVLVIQPSRDLQNFEVTPDGERFLVVRRSEDEIRPVLQVIVGWAGLLE